MAKFFIIILTCLCVLLESQATHSYVALRQNLDFNFNFNTSISSHLCNSQLAEVQDSFERNELWARQIRDAWGKVPSGMLSGNYFDPGSFDQCIDVRHYSNEAGTIAGQHCTLMIPYDLEPNNPELRLSVPSRS